MEDETVYNTIINFIQNEVKLRNTTGVIVGVSGGIDSAVMAVLAVKALGSENVYGLIMPDADITPVSDITDAQNLSKSLGIKYRIIKINEIKSSFLNLLHECDNNLILGNLVARIRMCILYYYSGLLQRLVLGTSNKTEMEIGYFTKYGDGGADLLPLGDLYKTQIFELAEYLKIPSNIVNKKSSARLWQGQITETELGISFERLDKILDSMNLLLKKYSFENVENNHSEILSKLEKDYPSTSQETIKRIYTLSVLNRHKVKPISVCRISQ